MIDTQMRPAVLMMLVAGALSGCGAGDPGAGGSGEEAEALRGTFIVLGEPIELEYQVIDGNMVFGGDMVLEPEDVAPVESSTPGEIKEPLFAKQSNSYLWPKGIVPYTIAASVSDTHRTRIRNAMLEWEEKTPVRFVKRTSQSAYVTFKEPADQRTCSANVGHIAGKERFVYLRDTGKYTACNVGVLTHEIGHTLGFLHEHQRPGRNDYVTIKSSCIPTGLESNFEIIWSGARKVGPYDIRSTMHYRSTTLSKSGCYSIVAKDGSALLHDWADLSAGDVKAANSLYGAITATTSGATTVIRL